MLSKAKAKITTKFNPLLLHLLKSVWLFPVILTITLITLTAFQLSGSSIGNYHTFFYGDKPDNDLLLNNPQAIRSDEWVVTTQKIIIQNNNQYNPVDKNIGNSEDVTLLADRPHNQWSTIFKPHNLGFLILPFDNAFALRWWIMSYLLILSSYFFILTILRGKKGLATLLALSFYFSPFFHWWYLSSTLSSVYFCLFGAVVFLKLIKSINKCFAILWSILLAYICVCFILILYPPFQIPCALVTLSFVIGYLLDNRKTINATSLKFNLILLVGALLVSGMVVAGFLYQKREIVDTIQNTAYPGLRIVKSGGFEIDHLLSSHLSPLFQQADRASAYSRPNTGATNQSESSNFILLLPFIVIPLLYLVYKEYKRKRTSNYTVLLVTITSVIYLAWLTLPSIDIIGKILLLDKVPLIRMVIGFGLLNFLFLILFIKHYSASGRKLSFKISVLLSLTIFIMYVAFNLYLMAKFPAFIGYKSAILLALPVPAILFFLARKHFKVAALILMIFSFLSVYQINPVYRGTKVLTQTPISQSIREIGISDDKKWVSEDILLENFAAMNDEPSLTGVYVYPQLEIWEGLRQKENEYIYNRYAHVNFTFDRQDAKINPTLRLSGGDQFNVKIDPCDPFLQSQNVGYLITSLKFDEGAANCAQLLKTVPYPNMNFYIYKLTF